MSCLSTLLPLLLLAPMTSAQDHPEPKLRAPLPSPEEIAKLPADGGPEFNRLVFESSPYLLQHARNPVDWYPWGEEAFERAKAEGKPVFLSIGYSTCHWCHVMEHESFEDDEVAALMNAGFVCIKVDREERPDLDGIYMSVTQAMTGRGGWPMTVVMTPEKKPWFAGTYFPKSGRDGRGGMMQLLPQLGTIWREQREEVLAQAESAVGWLRDNGRGRSGEAPRAGALMRAQQNLAQRYDAEHGGFGSAPKFPTPHNLRFLLRHWKRTGEAASLDMVVHTMRAMRQGGVWDHVGHGFHRYSTDARWLLPHFEKMLYDQALMAMALVEAWQASGQEDLRRTAEEVFAYVLRDMTSPAGGFYSAEDADSEGEEGVFYVWTPEELIEVLGAEDGAFAIDLFNVVEGGNFLEQSTQVLTGDSILHLDEDLDAVAGRQGLTRSELDARIESVRARLFEVRERRIHPLKDDKVLADWNGLMIAALAMGGRAFDEPRYVQAAVRAAEFLSGELRDEDGRLLKRWRNGVAGGRGVLEDHAYVVWGLIELYEASGDVRWLREALDVNAQLELHFADAEGGGYFAGPADAEDLIVRLKESYDGALPAGNSVAALNLVRLARITGDTTLEDRAHGILRAFGEDLRARPAASTQMLAALDFMVGPSFELVLSGDPEAEDTRAALVAVQRAFAPNKVLVRRAPGQAAEELAELVPYSAEQAPRDGRATLYLCREFTCEAPTHDVASVVGKLSVVGEGGAVERDVDADDGR